MLGNEHEVDSLTVMTIEATNRIRLNFDRCKARRGLASLSKTVTVNGKRLGQGETVSEICVHSLVDEPQKLAKHRATHRLLMCFRPKFPAVVAEFVKSWDQT